jgi:hypothetical protein
MAETPDDILRALADPERLAIAGHLARSSDAAARSRRRSTCRCRAFAST